MILKLAALGAIGYVGYRYLQQQKDASPSPTSSSMAGSQPDLSDPQVALAGGPLSSEAALRHAGQDVLPG